MRGRSKVWKMNGRCSSSECLDQARPWWSKSCRAILRLRGRVRSNTSALPWGGFAIASRRFPKFPDLVSKVNEAQLRIAANTYLKSLVATAPEAMKITDKLLTNYFFVGLIHLMFPKAKIIHTRRNPVDTCLSAFTKLFKDDMPHSYDLAELGRYYCKYRQLMDHWREVLPDGVMMTVDYEDVVADTRKQAERLVTFLGLEWSEACLDFHTSRRPVKTASVAQVRKPIYSTSVERWKRYGPDLRPLVEALGENFSGQAPGRRSRRKA